MAKIVVAAPTIRPGGGPGGYVFGLREALDQLEEQQNEYIFHGESSSKRDQDRGTQKGPRWKELLLRNRPINNLRRRTRPLEDAVRFTLSRNGRKYKAAVRETDATVLHGFYPAPYARYVKRRGKRLFYMPHSPSTTAEEKKMLAEAAGNRPSAADFNYYQSTEAQLIRASDAIVFPSQNAATPYLQAFAIPRGAIHYVRSACPPLCVSSKQPRPEPPIVLFAGRYVPHKGFDLFCEAASLVKQSNPRVRFQCIGAGPLNAISCVEDLGWHSNPAKAIAASSLVVIPNRSAYFDLLPIEVASLGIPMVMTPVGGNIDQSELLPAVTLTSDVTPLSIAESIMSTLAEIVREPSLGELNARAYWQHFSLKEFATVWDELLATEATRPCQGTGVLER